MNKLDQAIIAIRTLRQRIDAQAARIVALEAAQAPPAQRKRVSLPRPSDGEVSARRELWARVVLLWLQFGQGRMTKLRFAIRYHLGDPSDLSRFVNGRGKRNIPEGSVSAARYYAALNAMISELEQRRDHRFHGNPIHSQDFGARPQ